MKLIFATNNSNKVKEISAVLTHQFEFITLKQAGIDVDIPEPFDTLEENAYEKSRVISEMTGLDCFSEDTGLEVEVLNGEPGVKSARYAGDAHNDDKNIEKLLGALQGKAARTAHFRTVICLILVGKAYYFEGICAGHISEVRKGTKGFGYDPVFIPDGSLESFAEMELEEKNKYSHRKKATAKFIEFLNQYNGKDKG